MKRPLSLLERIRARLERDRRAFLLRYLQRDGISAEIGVWRGEFSRRILQATRPRELHLIDPWQFMPEFPTRIYGGSQAKSQADMDEIFHAIVNELGSHPAVRIHRVTSREAARSFADETFDWVYIDGNHSYEYVLDDLALFTPKVRRGGLVTGDDYRKGVKRAVDEFAASGRAEVVSLLNRQFVLRRV